MTIDDLNNGDRGSFVEAVGWVFENSPWVAERAWTRRPFDSLEDLHAAMTFQVASATLHEQLTLLCAHPDLGAARLNPGTTDEMSHASKREQAGAGLDSLTRPEVDRLSVLSGAYRDKFGFPFLYAVRGSTKQDILNALEARLPATRDAEIGEALGQVYRIARFRLEDVIA